MAAAHAGLLALNAGEVGADAIVRVDIAKMRYAAEVQQNLLPQVLGPAQFRPGFGYKAVAIGDCRDIPFVTTVETKAIVELSDSALRIMLDGVLLTRPAVTAAIANGTFGSNLTSWTDSDETGAVSAWATGGYMSLLGTGTNEAIREQQVTCNEPGVEHALRIIVERGPVTLKVGTASQADNLIEETSLRTGIHSIAFTPAADFYITLSSATRAVRLVDSIAIESSGIVGITTPWDSTHFRLVKFYQSLDVMFCACDGIIQKRIERRSSRSWSLVNYQVDDGPFRLPNFTAVTLTPSATFGNITLTASKRRFKSTHVGSIWRLTHSGQFQTAALSGDGQFSDPIRVTGISSGGANDRQFTLEITGVFVGSITVQRAFGTPDSWVNSAIYGPYNAPLVPTTIEDTNDNQIVYYRVGFISGDYTSGTATVKLTYPAGSQTGIVRVTAFTSATAVSAEVIKSLGSTEATSDWEEGEWSDFRGYPAAVRIHDGRLWWGWHDKVFGSVSDAYESYDDTIEGDSGPIVRSVTSGGADSIYWLLSSQRLLGATAQEEISIRSSSFDEPLTPTAFLSRSPSSRGSANVQAVSVDSQCVFVHRNTTRTFALSSTFNVGGLVDYTAADLNRLNPQACAAGIVELVVQRMPDTRIWAVLADGTCQVLTYEPGDEVAAWTPIVTNGFIRSICILPGLVEDEVWAVVKRYTTTAGVDTVVYYHEKMALASEARGGVYNKTMDSFVLFVAGPATTTITGLSHLKGRAVVVWGNNGPLVTADAPLTVNGSGAITVPTAVTNAVIGLAYDGKFKSAKLAYGAQGGTALTYPKRVDHLALLMNNVSWNSVKIGTDFTTMTGLHARYKGRPLSATEVLTTYDYDGSPFKGRWDTDARVCFQVQSPGCATFLGIVVAMDTEERRASAQAQNASN